MPNINSIKRNSDKASRGVWIEYANGIEVCVRPMPNKEFNESIQRQTRGKGRARRALSDSDTTELERMQRVAVAKHVLVNWRNVDDGGEPPQEIPYSPEAVGNFLPNEQGVAEFEGLYGFVLDVARDESLFLNEEAKEDAKN